MNPFEKANLERLASENEQVREIREFIISDRDSKIKKVAEDSIRLMVRILFDIHCGDLDKIKQELRGDAELIKGLDLDKIVNNEYKRQANPTTLRARYDEDTRRRFWATVISLERKHSEKLHDGAA